jgi:hypothetical protein
VTYSLTLQYADFTHRSWNIDQNDSQHHFAQEIQFLEIQHYSTAKKCGDERAEKFNRAL